MCTSKPIFMTIGLAAPWIFGAARSDGKTILVPAHYPTIQAAINNALNGDEIIVAAGTYPEAIDLLGWAVHLRSESGPQVTTIDGTGLGTSVVTCVSGEGPGTILEGFTVTGGTGTDPGGGLIRGGGMYNYLSSPTVRRCTFTGNQADVGGGMYNRAASPTVTDCRFHGNHANYDGGGMGNWSGQGIVANCAFEGNTADYGGGVANSGSSIRVANCLFTDNTASTGGGMSNNASSSPTVTNSTFTGNTSLSSEGGGMYNNLNSNPVVTNCILWADTGGEIHNSSSTPTVRFSDVQGGYAGSGNINANPVFASTGGGNFRLAAGSPCIDAGDNVALTPDAADLDGDGDVTEPLPLDLDRFARCTDDPDTPDTGHPDPNHPGMPVVDMGAYEYRPPIPGDLNGDGVVNDRDYVLFAACLTGPDTAYPNGCDPADLQADGDVDLADFGVLQEVFAGP